MKKISWWQVMLAFWLLMATGLTSGVARAQYTLRFVSAAYTISSSCSAQSTYGGSFGELNGDLSWDGNKTQPNMSGTLYQLNSPGESGLRVSAHIYTWASVTGRQDFTYIATYTPTWEITGTPNTQVDVEYGHDSTLEYDCYQMGVSSNQFSMIASGGGAITGGGNSGFTYGGMGIHDSITRHIVVHIGNSGKATFSIAVGLNLSSQVSASGGTLNDSAGSELVAVDGVGIVSLTRVP